MPWSNCEVVVNVRDERIVRGATVRAYGNNWHVDYICTNGASTEVHLSFEGATLVCPPAACWELRRDGRTVASMGQTIPHLTRTLENELLVAVEESHNGYPQHLHDMRAWYDWITDEDIDAISDRLANA